MKEHIVCAANWYPEGPDLIHGPKHPSNTGLVLCGHNHAAIIELAAKIFGFRTPQENQGFITNTNRWVNRKEAYQIAYRATQIKAYIEYPIDIDLYSEDLHHCRE